MWKETLSGEICRIFQDCFASSNENQWPNQLRPTCAFGVGWYSIVVYEKGFLFGPARATKTLQVSKL